MGQHGDNERRRRMRGTLGRATLFYIIDMFTTNAQKRSFGIIDACVNSDELNTSSYIICNSKKIVGYCLPLSTLLNLSTHPLNLTLYTFYPYSHPDTFYPYPHLDKIYPCPNHRYFLPLPPIFLPYPHPLYLSTLPSPPILYNLTHTPDTVYRHCLTWL